MGSLVFGSLLIVLVEFKIPLHKVLNTDFDRRARLVAHIGRQILGIGPGIGHITRLQRQQVHFRFLAQAIFDGADVIHELHRLLVADVVDAVRRPARPRVRVRRIPVRVGRRRVVHRANNAFDNVVDVGEVALVLAVVEHVDGLALENVLGKHEQRHVGTAERAIHSEESQAGRRQVVEIRIRVRHEFVGLSW